MTDKTVRLLTLLLSLTGLLTGCEAVKSANPLSPLVAGPIPGVNISEPKLLEPGPGWELDNAAQPVRLLIENASSNGQRPLTYTFEVASDVQFGSGSVMFSRGNVEPGEGGRTSIQMTDRLPTGRAFFWRARAEDGANTGAYSAAASFSVITPVVVDVPVPIEPVGGVKLSSNKPVFRIRNAARSGPAGQLVDTVQVARDEAFTSMVAIYQVNEQANETRIEPNLELPYDQTFFWRVRAYDSGPSNMVSAWSGAQAFRTSSPPPAPAPPPSPGGGGGRPGPCTSNSPLGIVECQRSKYPGHMSSGTTVNFERAVAHDLNANGVGGGPFGILRKGSGNSCSGYACDIICSGSGSAQKQWDILSDFEGAQSPAWNGPKTYPNIRVDTCEIQ